MSDYPPPLFNDSDYTRGLMAGALLALIIVAAFGSLVMTLAMLWR